jgi:curved DNA-binding protein CbpA
MDPFDLLALPRRPFLTEEEIGTAYRKLAGELHPDQAGGDAHRFKELGEALAILRDPSKRLRSLTGTSSGSLPQQAADLFPKIAFLIQQADALLEKRNNASNALAKALLAAPFKSLATELESAGSHLESWLASLEDELLKIDSHWPEHDPQAMNLLADSFSYAGRWQTQLGERKLALDCP